MASRKNDEHPVRISLGREYNLGLADNLDVPWAGFCRMFREPKRTPETFATYAALPPDRQTRLKARDGWYLGGQAEGGRRRKKSIRERDIVTLDFDDLSPEAFQHLREGPDEIVGLEYVCHTTRSHAPGKPRMRANFLLTEPVDAETYAAVARVLAHKIDPTMDSIDDVSFRVAQMMFMPVVSSDQEYVRWRHEGEALDWKRMLREWGGDWTDYTALPFSAKRGMRRPTKERAEDPWEKRGPVGAFCRAYPIPEAIEAFLSDVYEPGKELSGKPRYTYTPGTTANGAVVEDDGRFLYSHHGSDPVADMLVNAFDLVRIHRYGKHDLAKDVDGLAVTELPSYKHTLKFALADERTRMILVGEDLDVVEGFDALDPVPVDVQIASILGDVEPVPETPPASADLGSLPPYPGRPKPPRTENEWWLSLDLTTDGAIKPTLPNAVIVLKNARQMHGVLARDLFNGQVCARAPVRTSLGVIDMDPVEGPYGRPWTEADDRAVHMLLESDRGRDGGGFGMRMAERTVFRAVAEAASTWQVHPVLDYLLALPAWDGVPRVERLWMDYLGEPDREYLRETARQFLCGAIARLYHPGHKFDYVPIISGRQGLRKSTFVSTLFGADWTGELTVGLVTDKDSVEQMLGKWCLELAELASLQYSEIEAQKAFVSRTEDRVRLAYDRRQQTFRRQCVFVGTSNEFEYLKDTENRRYWPLQVLVDEIDTDRLARERDQIWAEALWHYNAMCADRDHRSLVFRLEGEAAAEALRRQDNARAENLYDEVYAAVEEWLNRPISRAELSNSDGFDDLDAGPGLALRTKTWRGQIVDGALSGMGVSTRQTAPLVSKVMANMPGWCRPEDGGEAVVGHQLRFGKWVRKRGYIRRGSTKDDIFRGWKIVADPTLEIL